MGNEHTLLAAGRHTLTIKLRQSSSVLVTENPQVDSHMKVTVMLVGILKFKTPKREQCRCAGSSLNWSLKETILRKQTSRHFLAVFGKFLYAQP